MGRKFTNPKIEGWNGYDPELVTGLYPNEVATDYAYVPFGGGQRRCAGDVFAMMEATVALSALLKKFSFELACDERRADDHRRDHSHQERFARQS